MIADRQLSHYPNNILSIVLTISLLGGILNWKFWFIPDLMKYGEEFRNPKQIRKGTIVLIGVGLAVFIIIGSSFLFFLRHRHTQRILNAETVNKYNTVTPTPLKQKAQSLITPPTLTSSHSQVEDTLEADTPSDQENDLQENTDQNRDKSVSQEKQVDGNKHRQSQEEQEEAKKLKDELEETIKLAKETQKESLELMREAIPMIVNHLNTLPQDVQRETLQQAKTLMISQISQLYPSELLPLLEEFNVIEDGWNMYLDMMADYGYTPPKGIK